MVNSIFNFLKASNKITYNTSRWATAPIWKILKKFKKPVIVLGTIYGNYKIGMGLYKTIQEKNDRLSEKITSGKNLEFNNRLQPGYFSFKASTERQRAQNALEKSNFSGRELLGQEAQFY